METAQRRVAHALAAAALVTASAAFIAGRAPIEVEMKEVQKIFYFHVGIAWTTFIAFGMTAVNGILYLRGRDPKADARAAAAAEVGVLYATLVLATGMLWARSAWNTWWNWEPRLTSTLVMWLIYVGYLLFRNSAEGESRRRHAAVYGILAFAMVPLVYYSIHLWGSLLHPPTTTVRRLDPLMYWGMGLGFLTMITVFFFAYSVRCELETASESVQALRRRALEGSSDA